MITDMQTSAMRDTILRFAEDHLSPFKIRVKPGGGEEVVPTLCPFCHGGESGDQGTFALSTEKGLFVCKRGSCGRRGRFEELAAYLNDPVSLNRPIPASRQAAWVLPDTVLLPPTEQIYQYFEKRKISRATVDAFHIAADEKGMIVFPFYENGVNVFEKFRRPWKPKDGEKKMKEWRFPGAKPILFGMDGCSFSQPLIITEGQIDAMSLYEAGVTNVVSVPSGCEDMDWVSLCYDWLEKFKTIILFGDSDEPGRKMIRELSKRLDESRCRIVEDYPENGKGGICKDANEVLYYCGEFELLDMVENAKEVPVKGLLDLASVPSYDPTSVSRIKTMIPELDRCIGGLAEGGITVFTGKAGDGKSTLSGLLLLNGIEQGYNVCAYSGELRKEKFQEWINLQCAGSDYITVKWDPVKEMDVPYLPYATQERVKDYYRGHFFLFDNNEIFEHNQAESILSVFTTAVRRHGCKLFLVDNMLTSLSDADEETKAQGRFVNALKKFATRYGVHVLIVAHPRKTKAGEQLRKDDVGGNSAIVNLADSAIVVERPDLRIIKNREGGIQRLISCCYAPDSRRIYQADKGDLNRFSWNKEGIQKPQLLASSLPEYQIQMAMKQPF